MVNFYAFGQIGTAACMMYRGDGPIGLITVALVNDD